ncbi:DUF4197 domain-containing protein [Hirschia baltica]|uniref:DUF4197 domain-containing protein n=1 Tax=Hirschia baltica (strain ATCC 49814 / DSM 5838 / IFAM 1418) TaxID=582402 RepID=C6XQN1_HIRBI|nr:DUF4197 domain-containing protein [Hirschia baltica]ACT58637.1 conserved hypothetical protein [Hirschia baltica ATCC 49814]
MSKIIAAFALLMSCATTGCVTDGNQDLANIFGGITEVAGPVTTEEVGLGLKEALKVGTERVVDHVSATNGYFEDDAIKIKLPGELAKVQKSLGRIGMDGSLNDLELKMNRAAEEAAPKAKKLFVSAVSSMTIDDAMALLNGGDNAATEFLRSKTETQLRQEFKPYVVGAMAQVGALDLAEKVVGQYLPSEMVSSVRSELITHAVDGALDGLFYYLAEEEQAIRNDPVKQTTKLLKRVFGG